MLDVIRAKRESMIMEGVWKTAEQPLGCSLLLEGGCQMEMKVGEIYFNLTVADGKDRLSQTFFCMQCAMSLFPSICLPPEHRG